MGVETTTMIVAYIAIACVVLVALYFQFKFISLDTRTREAETVARKFEKMLESTVIGEEIKKNYNVIQREILELKGDRDDYREDALDMEDEVDYLKEENHTLRSAYNSLLDTLKGKVEGVDTDTLKLPEEPVFKASQPQLTYHPMHEYSYGKGGRRNNERVDERRNERRGDEREYEEVPRRNDRNDRNERRVQFDDARDARDNGGRRNERERDEPDRGRRNERNERERDEPDRGRRYDDPRFADVRSDGRGGRRGEGRRAERREEVRGRNYGKEGEREEDLRF